MKCDACAAVIPDDAVFCSACGTDVSARGRDLPGPSEHETALAAANLLRLRKRYSEAEARCIEILRADPNNVHAHSMLGDIYLDQGRREDAIQWYQLALDLDPKSRPDREKLMRLRGDGASRSAGALGDIEDRAAGLSSLTLLRFVGLALAVFVLSAGAAILMRQMRKPRADAQAVSNAGAPQLTIPSVTASPAGAPRTSVRAVTGAPPEAASAGAEDETPPVWEAEVHAEQSLALSGALRPETSVTSVVMDEGGRKAVITLRRRVPEAVEGRALAAEAAVDAVRAAQHILQQSESLQVADIVVRVETPAAPEYTLLRARTDRASVVRDTSASTPERALRAFRWYRWTPAWTDGTDGSSDSSPGR
jgi:tetratricopeptide (TPR) repeat protein